MIVYYAMGAGLGHLTRARAVLYTLGLEREAVVITNSRYAADPRVMGCVRVLAAPSAENATDRDCTAWINAAIAKLNPDEIFLDTFPCGLYGEISEDSAFAGTPITYVARLLRWQRYENRLPTRPIALKRTLLVEDLSEPHQLYVNRFCASQMFLRLSDPPVALTTEEQQTLQLLTHTAQPFWLVAHSGPAHEVSELVAYAAELRKLHGIEDRLVLATPPQSDVPEFNADVLPISFYPITPLANLANRIITACGFNSMRQLEPFSFKHDYLPFDRNFDDQFRRAAGYAIKTKPHPAQTTAKILSIVAKTF